MPAARPRRRRRGVGARTLLLTHKRATIGEMSCNPAIGGLGKGHLVREIDALDGVMGRAIDRAGIQFRMLNRSKGPAVRGPRAQADRKLYRGRDRRNCLPKPRTSTSPRVRSRICCSMRRPVCAGVVLGDGDEIAAGAVVLTTGTFLSGLIHIGEEKIPAGRVGEAPSHRAVADLGARRLCPRAAQDRHAAAARRPHHRLGRARDPARRRPADAVFVPDRADHDAADRLPHHLRPPRRRMR